VTTPHSKEKDFLMTYDLTVIIPTYNEEANISKIIEEINSIFRKNSLCGEILIIDDDSPDGTITSVREMQKTLPNVNLIVRISDHGLSQSVAEGFIRASSEILVVIDADFSHPPALISQMYEEIRAGYDIVIGSRYMKGGAIKDWPLKRRILSFGATFLGRIIFPDISDPVSGFFALRKTVVMNAPLKPRGYKILLEVLGKGVWLKDKEIPFEFIDRQIGNSKLQFDTILEYLKQLFDICVYSFFHHESAAWKEWMRICRFGLVGISGIAVNLGILTLLLAINVPEYLALVSAIVVSIVNNFIWNDIWTYKNSPRRTVTKKWERLCSYYNVAAGGAIINIFTAVLLTRFFGMNIILSDFIGTLIGFSWNFLISRRFTWGRK